MPTPMLSLKRAPNGDWFARKVIPADVREAYKAAHGVSREELFRRPAGLREGQAKQELREWDALVSGRIEALRSRARGEGVSLTSRQAHGLAGDWYAWFVARYEEDPGTPEAWDSRKLDLEAAYERWSESEGAEPGNDDAEPEAPAVRRYVRRQLATLAEVPSFLGGRDIILTSQAHDAFLDILEPDFVAALALLRRRSGGDYRPDQHPERFPDAPLSRPSKAAGLTCWALFEAWVRERRPGVATVNRWRGVFLAMEEHFKGRDIATITAEDAIEWKGTLVTEARSPQVANDVWLRAARVAFGWAKDNKRIPANPFEGVSIAASAAPQKLREREFMDEEWATILRATTAPVPPRMASHNAAARRWVPWLCAYTGSRPGEVAQLRGQDVQWDRGGFWTIRITPEAGTVKTGQARVVPLHDHLIEQGFVEFAQRGGAGPLFYDPEGARVTRDDPTNPARPPWVKAVNKLGDWVRGLGVDDPNISPSHAWRHTFKRRAARAKIEKRIRFAFCGHTSEDEGDHYETPTVADMAEELKRFPRYELEEKPKAGGEAA